MSARPLPPRIWEAGYAAPFWAKVDQPADGCWKWQGPVAVTGRAVVSIDRTVYYAYRIAYALTTGQDPGALLVCHHCDNPVCVRPNHLFLGDHAANSRDMWNKGRGRTTSRRGEAHPGCTIPDAVIGEIRALYATGDFTQAELAARFGVAQSTVGRWTRGTARSDSNGPRVSVGKGRNQARQFPGVDRSVACSDPLCQEPARTKGLCRLHYMRAWKARRVLKDGA